VKVVAALVVSLAFAVVCAGPALAIHNGVPDGDAHPNVGFLAFDVDGEGQTPPFALCSGSVISDSVFLTAAHCIAAIPGVQWVVSLEGGSPADPVATTGFFPDDFPFALTVPVHRSIGAVVHPDFGGGQARENDLAVVLFPEGTFDGVTPVDLPTAGLLDELAAQGGLHDETVTLVGYGSDAELGPPRYGVFAYRQTATAPIQAVTTWGLRIQQAEAATGQGGLCYGDSGSPQFLGGSDSNLVVSSFSRHPTTCGGVSRGQRLDTASAREFLSQFVGLP
jgi:Trypsin